jgi:hypothetical protein
MKVLSSLGAMMKAIGVAGVAVLLALGSAAAPALAEGAGRPTGDARVDALLGRMTLAEKLALLHDSPEDPKTYQG